MKLENKNEMESSDTNGSPVSVILLVIIVFVIVLLWTFFPSLFIMVLVFLGSLIVAYNTQAVQEDGGKVMW
jgi:uncharacterized protein YqhQ